MFFSNRRVALLRVLVCDAESAPWREKLKSMLYMCCDRWEATIWKSQLRNEAERERGRFVKGGSSSLLAHDFHFQPNPPFLHTHSHLILIPLCVDCCKGLSWCISPPSYTVIHYWSTTILTFHHKHLLLPPNLDPTFAKAVMIRFLKLGRALRMTRPVSWRGNSVFAAMAVSASLCLHVSRSEPRHF